jgi:hypothetical protein
MKLLTAIFFCALLGWGLCGCSRGAGSGAPASQAPNPDAEIRAAILARLATQATLNLQSFDTDVKQVTIQGDRAQAQVDFRVKNGPGAMSMTYQLQRHDGAWTVLDANPEGSDFSHPGVRNPQSAPAEVGGSTHSLADTIRAFTTGAPGQPPLPPGTSPADSAPAAR